MANYYVDFVGLNTFIYEPVGWSPEDQMYPNTTLPHYEIGNIGPNGNIAIHMVFQNSVGIYSYTTLHEKGVSLDLNYYKNYSFPLNLPNTASFFPALMLRRNGPYGFGTWKQVRIGENPLTRRQKRENIMTIVREPGNDFKFKIGGKITSLKSKYGDIEAYREIPVISKYKPVVLDAKSDGQDIKVATTLANDIVGFNNDELNRYYKLDREESEDYEALKNSYLGGSLQSNEGALDEFKRIVYRETVFPQKMYMYRKFKRQRTTFSFPWKDNRPERTTPDSVFDGFATRVTQSIWPMDVDEYWTQRPTDENRLEDQDHGFGNGAGTFGRGRLNNYGTLQNAYSSYFFEATNAFNQKTLHRNLGPAALYAHRHMLTSSLSLIGPSGMLIEGLNMGTLFNHMSVDHLPSGEAAWEAAEQSSNAPFYNNYEDYFTDMKGRYKEYSILPEFRISEHVREYQTLGDTEEKLDIFELTGGLLGTTNSSEDDFYTIFTNSDFLEHFEIVQEDHKEISDPSEILIKCTAVKKFLPYDGFYPQQRTVTIAQQFYNSYSGSFALHSGSTQNVNVDIPAAAQPIMTPLFAPGVLFNAIKSGVAVDYPIFTGSVLRIHTPDSVNGLYGVSRTKRLYQGNGSFYLKPIVSDDQLDSTVNMTSQWDRRVPFRALYEPERFLADYVHVTNIPHPSGNLSSSVLWDGTGDNLYKLMIHNFLAEVPEFFMDNAAFSTIASKKSSHPSVGNAVKDKKYTMRVKMYKSMASASANFSGSSEGGFDLLATPQAPRTNRENFTMYSRPTAFGPPTWPIGNAQLPASPVNPDPTLRPESGFNMCFTPPYYDGQAWADITFVPDETRKYSINEIINRSSVRYYRYLDEGSGRNNSNPDVPNNPLLQSNAFNQMFLQISASVNIFGKASVKTITEGGENRTVVASTREHDDQQWVIQPRFETPMLNFNHLSASNSVTLPLNGSQSVPRGMWHQYGRIEEDPSKGVFLQVTDIPVTFSERVYNQEGVRFVGGVGNVNATGSLAELCGFDSNPVKLGKISPTKKISEAIVAVPFIEEEGRRKFFTLKEDDITIARVIANGSPDQAAAFKRITGIKGDPSPSVQKMVTKMKEYVFPPSMDFYNNSNIPPFAMYIFEFHHVLTKQDLSNIWQGLRPDIGKSHYDAASTFGHKLLKEELLGSKKEFQSKMKWMIFKAKKRAKTNYYPHILERTRGMAGHIGVLDDEYRKDFESILKQDSEKGKLRPTITYNWPYDFFSLVELAKVDVSVAFTPPEPVTETTPTPEPTLPVSEIPEETPPPEKRKPKGTLYRQQYIRAAGITRNYYKPPNAKGPAGTFVPIVEDVGGDKRIELRRVYFRAAGITEIQFKYDRQNPKAVSGDQT